MPLAPLDLGRVLSAGFSTWGRHWRLLLGISVVAALVQTLGSIAQVRSIPPAPRPGAGRPDPSETFADLGTQMLSSTLGLLVFLLVSAAVGGLMAAVGRSAVLGHPTSWGAAWAVVRPRLLALVGVSLLIGLVSGIGFVFCIVPGLIVLTVWSLAVPAMVTERLPVMQALTRSYHLVKGDAWRVFGILLLVGVATILVSAVLSLPLSLLSGFPAEPTAAPPGWGATLLAALGQLLAGILTLTAIPLTAYFLYVDQRIRRERYDLQLAQEAQQPPPPGSAAGP